MAKPPKPPFKKPLTDKVHLTDAIRLRLSISIFDTVGLSGGLDPPPLVKGPNMALTWYVDKAAGSDNNSGSTVGSPKASGTQAAFTLSVATIDLILDTPDLSGVVDNVDTIRLAGSQGGLQDWNTEIFIITAHDNTLKTVTVSSAPTNSQTGQAWAIGGAFATISRAFTVHRNNFIEHTYVKASAVYNETVTSDHALGTGDKFSKLEGYTTTPGDGGVVEIDGQSVRATGFDLPTKYLVFRNFRVHHHTGVGMSLGDNGRVFHCESDHNGTIGIRSTDGLVCFRCHAHNNGSDGIYSVQGHAVVLCCVVNDNGAYGVSAPGGIAYKSVFRGNGTKAVALAQGEGTGRLCAVLDCLIDGDGKTTDLGIEFQVNFSQGGGVTAVNNIIYDCTKGIAGRAADGLVAQICSANNLINGNTTAYSDWETTEGEVTAAPTFVDEGVDYTPADDSPAIEAGVDQIDLGLVASAGKRSAIGGIEPVAGAGSKDFRVRIGV